MNQATTPPQRLDAQGIASRVPHAGRMCLLNRLERWDDHVVVCSATGHRDASNPLRTASGLLAPAAIEYAAQAMALHGALLAERDRPRDAPTPGFLASVRGVQLHVARLDDLSGTLHVEATREAGQGHHILYRFRVSAEGTPVAEGRATVVLDASAGRT